MLHVHYMSLSPALKRHLHKVCNMFSYQFHLVLSHFGTSMSSTVETIISHTSATTFLSAKWNTAPAGRRFVETNLSWNCLVSWLLNFEHPSVLLFTKHFVLQLIFLYNLHNSSADYPLPLTFPSFLPYPSSYSWSLSILMLHKLFKKLFEKKQHPFITSSIKINVHVHKLYGPIPWQIQI